MDGESRIQMAGSRKPMSLSLVTRIVGMAGAMFLMLGLMILAGV